MFVQACTGSQYVATTDLCTSCVCSYIENRVWCVIRLGSTEKRVQGQA